MPAALEREIKLRFDSPAAAREQLLSLGAEPIRCRRLQDDHLLDTPDEHLRKRRCVLRLRLESGKSVLTFKGPVQPGMMKTREEWETLVTDGEVLLTILNQLGFRVWFRYQKFREEFALEGATVAIDETPMGTFVEVEGAEQAIIDAALGLGRTPGEYLLDSYRTLYLKHCEECGADVAHMLFDHA